jgi:hypothetical protein
MVEDREQLQGPAKRGGRPSGGGRMGDARQQADGGEGRNGGGLHRGLPGGLHWGRRALAGGK